MAATAMRRQAAGWHALRYSEGRADAHTLTEKWSLPTTCDTECSLDR